MLWNIDDSLSGLYTQAEMIVQCSISARTRTLGPESADTFSGIDVLASILQYQGKYEDAEQLNRRALEGSEKALGEEHPNTLTSVELKRMYLG
jgi:hypothetical protein